VSGGVFPLRAMTTAAGSTRDCASSSKLVELRAQCLIARLRSLRIALVCRLLRRRSLAKGVPAHSSSARRRAIRVACWESNAG
jgi:hypothetical protein